MDTLTIISNVMLAIYDIAGIVVIVWGIFAVRRLLRKGGR
jgi:hypothetical protein